MLTRLKVTGFKNLDDIDVRLGPFTCIAGPNGVGKSNFFDAIAFLSALADKPLIDAALSVRGGEGGDVRRLFHRVGNSMANEMSFLVEMIIPATGEDALGQEAEASATYLKYELVLRYRVETAGRPLGGLEVVSERMNYLNLTQAKRNLGFKTSPEWIKTAIRSGRTSNYISTDPQPKGNVVSLKVDSKGGTGGKPRKVHASSLPRTMLSSVNNAAEHRTLVLARQEMMSWTQLQLEPSALRAPDGFVAPHSVDARGAHLPATLYHLAHLAEQKQPGGRENLYAQMANRLAELIQNVDSIAVDLDEKRQLLNIVMTDRQKTPHLASALSDGTLRFLALTVMEADPNLRALLCLEEPENGMHPSRIPAMLRLLQALAVDPEEPVGPDNPLRQVIINTHSPSVVAEVLDDALLVAQATLQEGKAGQRSWGLNLLPLPDTWRTRQAPEETLTIARGMLLAYLNPIQDEPDTRSTDGGNDSPPAIRPQRTRPTRRRVKDREDLQVSFQFLRSSERA